MRKVEMNYFIGLVWGVRRPVVVPIYFYAHRKCTVYLCRRAPIIHERLTRCAIHQGLICTFTINKRMERGFLFNVLLQVFIRTVDSFFNETAIA